MIFFLVKRFNDLVVVELWLQAKLYLIISSIYKSNNTSQIKNYNVTKKIKNYKEMCFFLLFLTSNMNRGYHGAGRDSPEFKLNFELTRPRTNYIGYIGLLFLVLNEFLSPVKLESVSVESLLPRPPKLGDECHGKGKKGERRCIEVTCPIF